MAKGKKSTPRKPQTPQPPLRQTPVVKSKNPQGGTNVPAERKNEDWIPGLVIALVAFFLYAPSLRYGYVLDDQMMYTNNQFVQEGFAGIGKILSKESFAGFFGEQQNLLVGGRYRPLSLVTFAIEKGLFGQNAPLSHFINLVLYALLGWLAYHTLRRIFPSSGKGSWLFSLAGLSALLYVLHPIHSEVVANVKGRDEIMAALGAIGALYASWRYAQEGNMRWNIIAAVVFFLGLLSKENTLTFAAVIPLALYYFGKTSLQRIGINTGTLLLTSVLYLILRYAVVGQLLGDIETDPNPMNDPFVNLSAANKYATIFLTLGWYLKLLVFPHPLTHDYYPYHVPVVGFDDWRALLGLALQVALVGIAAWGLVKKNVPTFAAAFYLITLSIVSNLPFTVGAFMNERFVFLPSLGFSLFSAWLIADVLPKRMGLTAGQSYPLGLGLIAVLSLGYAVKTWTRLPDWKDETTLNAAAYRVSTGSARAKLFHAVAIFEKEYKALPTNPEKLAKLAEIMPFVEEATQILPAYKSAWGFLAGLAGERYVIDRQLKPMLDVFARAAVYAPDDKYIHQFLAYAKPSAGPVPVEMADFAYQVGYVYFAQQKRDLEHAKKYLEYGKGGQPVDPKIEEALQKLK
jgi:protein O-mannosyl-transferase